MKVYRASKSESIFRGMHFATDAAEAAAYITFQSAGTGDSFGGIVREYEISGDIFDADMDALSELIAAAYDNGDDLGDLERPLSRVAEEGMELARYPHLVARVLRDAGCDYVWQVIEQYSEILDLVANDYSFIKFAEVSVANDHSICHTIRYIGRGSVVLAA
jgi:hypothetical protein